MLMSKKAEDASGFHVASPIAKLGELEREETSVVRIVDRDGSLYRFSAHDTLPVVGAKTALLRSQAAWKSPWRPQARILDGDRLLVRCVPDATQLAELVCKYLRRG